MLPPISNDPEGMARKLAWVLPRNQPKNLRALSFSFTAYEGSKPGRIVVRSHFFQSPSEDDLELIKDLEAELYAQTDNKFDYVLEAETAPIGTAPRLLPYTAWIDGAERYRL